MPKKCFFLSILSGLLLSLPWYTIFPGYILHVALVPLLIAEHTVFEKKDFYSSRIVFLLASVTFFIWNILTMWWVFKVTTLGAMLAISANSMLFAIVFWAFHVIKRIMGKRTGNWSFVVFWLAFEYYCLHGDFAQPWLTLGNGLANVVTGIQWFEYTGALGGSLWILLGNLFIFETYLYYKQYQQFKQKQNIFAITLLGIVPIVISFLLLFQQKDGGTTCKIAIIQPNVDPFTEKFSADAQSIQLKRILQLADSLPYYEADYYLAPETAIDNNIWENTLMNNFSLFEFRNFINKHTGSAFILGAITYKEYEFDETKSLTARYNHKENKYYDVFNTALQIDETFLTPIYHKSKLVIGVERVPFQGLFKFMDKYLVNLGGSTGSLGTQKERSVFINKNRDFAVAPVICYESVYGEYVTDYVKKGANLIFVLTNDGWWKGTMGYMQHLQYARLRAIETRRSIARCANTGISAFINNKGEITQSTNWLDRTVLYGNLHTNNRITFYVQYGDYLGRIAIFLTIIIIMVSFVSYIKSSKKN